METVTLVVGRNGFIGRTLMRVAADSDPAPRLRFVSHDALTEPDVFEGVGRILNCALPSEARRRDLDAEEDFDARLGRVAAERGLGYVMLSSRNITPRANLPQRGIRAARSGAPTTGVARPLAP